MQGNKGPKNPEVTGDQQRYPNVSQEPHRERPRLVALHAGVDAPTLRRALLAVRIERPFGFREVGCGRGIGSKTEQRF